MKNIFLVGKAGSGKTTCANYLNRKYGYRPVKLAQEIYDISKNYFDTPGKDRKLLQILGTDAGRNYVYKDIWVERFFENIMIVDKTCDFLKKPRYHFVADDCRFYNEYDGFLDNNWFGIYINCPDEIRYARLLNINPNMNKEELNHSSEKEIDTFRDRMFWINGGLSEEEMYRDIENSLSGIDFFNMEE